MMGLTMAMVAQKHYMRVARDDKTNLQTFGGSSWGEVIASGYRKVLAQVAMNSVEEWEIENKPGGWFHPVHIHLIDFKIVSRNGKAPLPCEVGPKDVVYVGEGETVKVPLRFGPYESRCMVHCHNLPHEEFMQSEKEHAPLKALVVNLYGRLLAGSAVIGGATISVYMILYLLTIAVTNLCIPAIAAFLGGVVSGLIVLVGIPFVGHLADRVAPAKVITYAAIGALQLA